jgi:hypothetical protein
MCDAPQRNQADLITHQRACAEVVVSHIYPPIPVRNFDWSAHLDGYDGAPDAGWQPVGSGPTREAAIADLATQIEEHDA